MGPAGAAGALSKLRLLTAASGAFALASCVSLPPLLPRRDPLSVQEHLRLAAAYERQGLKAEAETQYEAATRKDPKDAEAWIARGNAAFNWGEYGAAESAFKRALKVRPHHPGASNNLAAVYLAQDRDLDRAQTLAEDALAQGGPLKPYVLDTLAQLHLRLKRCPQAKSALDTARAGADTTDGALREQLRKTRREIDSACRGSTTAGR